MYKPSTKMLGFVVVTFLAIGLLMTTINHYSATDFGECGTAIFNPLIILGIWGLGLNIIVYLITYVLLNLGKRITKF